MSDAVNPTLNERVLQFQMMELPGQPMMMHMGTSYLVGDLDRARRELIETLIWVRDNYAAGATSEINSRINCALTRAA